MVGTTQCGNDRNSQCGKMKNLLSLKIFSSNQLISDSLVKSLLSRDFCQKCVSWERISEISTVWNLLPQFFGKNYAKVTVLLKKLLNSWFDEIFFFGGSRFFNFPHWELGSNSVTLWKNQKFTLTKIRWEWEFPQCGNRLLFSQTVTQCDTQEIYSLLKIFCETTLQ